MHAYLQRTRWYLVLAIAALVPMLPGRVPVPAPQAAAVTARRCDAQAAARAQRARASDLERQLDRIADRLTDAEQQLDAQDDAQDTRTTLRLLERGP